MAASSSNRPARPQTPFEPKAEFIDWGPALPESYGKPRVLALVRDPRCYVAAWEEGDQLRACDRTSGTAEERGVGRTGVWYFEGLPEHEYDIELLSGGKVVARSARIRLPRLDPASAVDPDWSPSAGQEEILRALRGARDPVAQEAEERGNSGSWRRRVAGMPASRPSRTP
ncbi:MAG: hypothetical protein JO332_02550 [Planctomycetaceae bacterium]|nr:hypothetical protein [Planctomycetaceae bacterium]